jgi:hypothetical protein
LLNGRDNAFRCPQVAPPGIIHAKDGELLRTLRQYLAEEISGG